MKSTFKSALNNTALAAFASVTLLGSTPVSTAAVFAKYDGIDGESADANHDQWIDVLSVSWGMHRPAGATRQRGAVVVQDLTITGLIDKSFPKLMESCVTGQIIPKLELETTANYGGSRATYLNNDDDNDGIADDLEIKGGTNPFRDDADEDLDGDGQSNRDESIANTRMNDPSDYFGIERIRRTQAPEGLQMTLSFPVSGGRHYRLLASSDPSIPTETWIVLDSFHIPEGSPEEGADVQLNPNVLNNASSLFFRVEVSLESAPLDPTPIGPLDPIAPLPFDPIIPINPDL